MKYKTIIIVTYGRSGSTLLMNMLNNSGCMIYGENNNFFYGLFNSYKSIKEITKHISTKVEPWFNDNNFNNIIFIRNVKNLIKDIYGTHDIIGFKEIRYTPKEIAEYNDFDSYLHFLEKIFDDVFFIFNTRNKEQVRKSKWWNECDSDYVTNLLKETEDRFYHYMQNKKNVYHIDYEDLINKTDRLKVLYSIIGLEYNKDTIDKTLKIKYSKW